MFFWPDHLRRYKEIRKLDYTKASQDTDIPSSIIKDNADVFADFLDLNIIRQYPIVSFQQDFKMLIFHQSLRKIQD